ncbi:hypothetical protein LXL04_013875 [Taraxacum kok-saghyz]
MTSETDDLTGHQGINRQANDHSPDSESLTPCNFSESLSDFEMGDTLIVITVGRDSGVAQSLSCGHLLAVL